MNHREYKIHRSRLGHTQQSMAKAIGVSLRTAQRYEYGETSIPDPVARLIKTMEPENER